MLLSLYTGWLNPFFWAAEHAQVQGIDYFSLPKAYQNLLAGKSAFDTWGQPVFGPWATWYLAHPAFAVWVGFWFSYLSPWASYTFFVLASVGVTLLTAWLMARFALTPTYRALMYVLLLCAFPMYWTLYVGNIQQFFVLSLGLVHLGLFGLAFPRTLTWSRYAQGLLLAGLLISFFSKPLVILMIPMLLLVRATRITTIKALAVYSIVSLLFIVVPVLNPEGTGLSRVIEVAMDTDYIKSGMNIYTNNFQLNADMKDNSMHWLNLIAQSDFYLNHIEVYSFPVFVNSVVGDRLPGLLFKLPILLTLLCALALLFVKDNTKQVQGAMWLSGAVVCTFFLSYNTVWEYQYTAVLPFVAMLALLFERNIINRRFAWVAFGAAAFIYLPSLYVFIGSAKPDTATINLMRITRVLPVLVLFVLAVIEAVRIVLPKKATAAV